MAVAALAAAALTPAPAARAAKWLAPPDLQAVPVAAGTVEHQVLDRRITRSDGVLGRVTRIEHWIAADAARTVVTGPRGGVQSEDALAPDGTWRVWNAMEPRVLREYRLDDPAPLIRWNAATQAELLRAQLRAGVLKRAGAGPRRFGQRTVVLVDGPNAGDGPRERDRILALAGSLRIVERELTVGDVVVTERLTRLETRPRDERQLQLGPHPEAVPRIAPADVGDLMLERKAGIDRLGEVGDTAARAASGARAAIVCARRASLLESPQGMVVGAVLRGDRVRLLRRDRSRRWLFVRTDLGGRGWLARSHVCT